MSLTKYTITITIADTDQPGEFNFDVKSDPVVGVYDPPPKNSPAFSAADFMIRCLDAEFKRQQGEKKPTLTPEGEQPTEPPTVVEQPLIAIPGRDF